MYRNNKQSIPTRNEWLQTDLQHVLFWLIISPIPDSLVWMLVSIFFICVKWWLGYFLLEGIRIKCILKKKKEEEAFRKSVLNRCPKHKSRSTARALFIAIGISILKGNQSYQNLPSLIFHFPRFVLLLLFGCPENVW